MDRRRAFEVVIANQGGDTTKPTVTITSTATGPTATTPIPITITFSEVVTGFVVGDITVSNCTLSSFATADNKVFTVNATPIGSAVTLDIAAGVCQDAAGNLNQAATQFAISYQPWTLAFNGSSATVSCGSDAGLDNLMDNEVTLEIFIKQGSSPNATALFLDKSGFGGIGWEIQLTSTGQIKPIVQCATTDATNPSPVGYIGDTNFHHIAIYFNDAGDRKIYLAKDGVWMSMGSAVAGVGAIVSDAAQNFRAGGPGSFSQFQGNLGWLRVSNNDRYVHGVNFTPPKLGVYPAVDANTLGIWKLAEGIGTALDNAEGTAARDGVITAATWEQQTF